VIVKNRATQRARILVVDDELSVLLTLAANLELAGFEVREAGSGEQALELIQQESFDLILSDVCMPGISGVELHRELKRLLPEVPVVLMTAFAQEEELSEALRTGVFTVLPKPFEIGHVVQTLRRAYRRPLALVVDPVEQDAAATAAALCALGLKARTAPPGELLAVMQQEDVDVCVVELETAAVGAAPTLAQLRELDPSLILIVSVGESSPQLMASAARAGVHAFLRKPLAPQQLVEHIAKARGQGASGNYAGVRRP
jgi:DNA-binding NtrC family response regulator